MLNLLQFKLVLLLDAPENWQMGIQDPASPALQGMIKFHHFLMYFVIMIAVAVCWMLARAYIHFNEKANSIPQIFTHSSWLEIVWTILPAILLLCIAVPSFSLLYSLDAGPEPKVTIKIVGHQWYWTYEYSDFFLLADGTVHRDGFIVESYMIPTKDLSLGRLRLLDVEQEVTGKNLPHIPIKVPVRLLITSADILHSWSVPSLGVKVDACPGRLSQVILFIDRRGTFYGQCSEICGVKHGYMPIVVKGVPEAEFKAWRLTRVNK